MVARWAHNPKAGGSIPSPATKRRANLLSVFFLSIGVTVTVGCTVRKFFTIFYLFIKMLLYLQRLSCVIRQQACLEGVLSGFWSDNLSPRFLGMSFKIK